VFFFILAERCGGWVRSRAARYFFLAERRIQGGIDAIFSRAVARCGSTVSAAAGIQFLAERRIQGGEDATITSRSVQRGSALVSGRIPGVFQTMIFHGISF
jgi:hypothetical protein